MIKRFPATAFLLCIGITLWANEVPRIIHFTKQEYRAQYQNWNIAQGPDQSMYFANTGGLLKFDGVRWETFGLPFGQVVRSVHCDKQGRVFTGGYGTTGFWEKNENGLLQYTSLLDTMTNAQAKSEEYWHIIEFGKDILFQSFSLILKFDGKKTQLIRPPGNTMFSQKVGKKLIFPCIYDGLFEFGQGDSFSKINGSDIFSGKLVAAILPTTAEGFITCTQNDGIFLYKAGRFQPWEAPVNKELKNWQLNKAIRMSNGDYVFGTILNGIFVTDPKGNIRYHINKENGLQNNTVLSLFEDSSRNLWVGLDRGIDLLVMNSPLNYYQDKTGEIGTVYAATLFENRLYVGSNQGLFYKPFPSTKETGFKLMQGSQGQVWHLEVFDDQLIGAHNSGVFSIKNEEVHFLNTNTGSYYTVAHPTEKGLLFQGTYTGIIVLTKNETGKWNFGGNLTGFDHPARFLQFDTMGNLWVKHSRGILSRLTLEAGTGKILDTKEFVPGKDFPIGQNLDLLTLAEDILIQSGTSFLKYDQVGQSFKPALKVEGGDLGSGNFKLVSGKQGEWFKVFADQVTFIKDGKASNLAVSLPIGNEQVIPLNDSLYLFCTDEGYGIFNTRLFGTQPKPALHIPRITEVSLNGKKLLFPSAGRPAGPLQFLHSENNLRFSFAQPLYTSQPVLRYRLVGFDEDWSAYGKVYEKEYTNLPAGNYIFRVESLNGGSADEFPFMIELPWYEDFWVKIVLILLLVLLSRLLVKIHDHRLHVQKRKLQLEKQRELQQQRVQAKNEMLQAEILNKNRKLADSTMELVRKNEMLQKIKIELTKLEAVKEKDQPIKAIRQLNHLIDSHLSSDEDWKVFESNFNQLHNQFFKRLKEQYPELSPGDLRLAAYLKMNLSSKELAPLLNISLRGVENKRYRLRKKMGVEADANLTELLMKY